MRYYPLMLDLRDRRCLVAGGGTVAERKVRTLLDAGAAVTVVSPAATEKLRQLAADGRLHLIERRVEDRDAEGCLLVIVATDDPAVNERLARFCRERAILVNVITSPEAGAFLVPSVVERGDLLISVSTCGTSPALARRIRERLEAEFGREYALFLEEMRLLRERLLREVPDEAARKRIFEAVVNSDVLDLLKQGDRAAAVKRIDELARKRP